jgi:hypothetical protein
MLATVATLFFVPVVFSLLHREAPAAATTEPKEDASSGDLGAPIPAT